MTILSEQQGQALVRLARVTLESKFTQETELAQNGMALSLADEIFKEKHGVFVTLTINGQLRGCIGNLSSNLTVLEGVKRNAISAAQEDYRFQPLRAAELAKVNIEVSVLSDPAPLKYSDANDLQTKLRPGVDGVILRQGMASATFLPQVWEQLPNPEDFLAHLCQKAGLTPAAWRSGQIEIETYQVQHFSEG